MYHSLMIILIIITCSATFQTVVYTVKHTVFSEDAESGTAAELHQLRSLLQQYDAEVHQLRDALHQAGVPGFDALEASPSPTSGSPRKRPKTTAPVKEGAQWGAEDDSPQQGSPHAEDEVSLAGQTDAAVQVDMRQPGEATAQEEASSLDDDDDDGVMQAGALARATARAAHLRQQNTRLCDRVQQLALQNLDVAVRHEELLKRLQGMRGENADLRAALQQGVARIAELSGACSHLALELGEGGQGSPAGGGALMVYGGSKVDAELAERVRGVTLTQHVSAAEVCVLGVVGCVVNPHGVYAQVFALFFEYETRRIDQPHRCMLVEKQQPSHACWIPGTALATAVRDQ